MWDSWCRVKCEIPDDKFKMDFLMTMLKIENPNDRVECGFPDDTVELGISW
jgi:hypothetical protein